MAQRNKGVQDLRDNEIKQNISSLAAFFKDPKTTSSSIEQFVERLKQTKGTYRDAFQTLRTAVNALSAKYSRPYPPEALQALEKNLFSPSSQPFEQAKGRVGPDGLVTPKTRKEDAQATEEAGLSYVGLDLSSVPLATPDERRKYEFQIRDSPQFKTGWWQRHLDLVVIDVSRLKANVSRSEWPSIDNEFMWKTFEATGSGFGEFHIGQLPQFIGCFCGFFNAFGACLAIDSTGFPKDKGDLRKERYNLMGIWVHPGSWLKQDRTQLIESLRKIKRRLDRQKSHIERTGTIADLRDMD